MKLFSVILFAILFAFSCGALPRKSHDDQDATVVTTAAMTGIVIQSTDSSYSSTTVYYYDLAGGHISLLPIKDKSGDTFVKWLKDNVYIFDRNNLNYSVFKPKTVVGTQVAQPKIPGADSTSDPFDVIMGPQSELIMAMNLAGTIVVANSEANTVSATITGKEVDSGISGQSFRPAGMWLDDNKVWITHQALDSSYKATGAGRIYTAATVNDHWSWQSTTGLALTISNPVFVSARADHTAFVGGVCYASMGTSCVAGVDRVNTSTNTVEHLSAWDPAQWKANGGFYDDLSDDTLLACVTGASSNKNTLVRYTIADGSTTKLIELSGSTCGGVIADRVAMKIFVGQGLSDGSGSITILDKDGTTESVTTLTSGISGLTASFD